MGLGRHRFGIVLGQRMSWPALLTRAQETEALGFDAFFLVDHFYGLKDLDDPTHEAYTMLAALAPFTQRVRLGVMVCGNTYRNPAFLLKQAITVDHVSGGRVDFGVGAGWVEREHEAFGWEFPTAKERVDRFAEALEIWEMLQQQSRTTYDGTHYQLLDAPFQPKSLQPGGLPVLIGGSAPRMLRLTARYADIWNIVGSPDEVAAANVRMDDACAKEGRDPVTLVRSVSPSINLLESIEAFEAGVSAYHSAGAGDIYLPWPRVEAEAPVLRAVARDLMPRFRGEGQPAESGTAPHIDLATASPVGLAAIMNEIVEPIQRHLLDWLIDHPDERFDGAALRTTLGIELHRDVTRAFALMGERFRERGMARPWSEAQRGYMIDAAAGGQLRDARESGTNSDRQ